MTKITFFACAVLAATLFAACGTSNNEGSTDMNNQTSNAVIESIMTRSSIRQYTSQKVSRDTIETILRAAMAAPTAVDKRPWKFVVVEDADLRKALSDTLHINNAVAHAPVAIVVCGNRARFLPGQSEDYWIEDCSAATENLLLAAHAMGLGAVWCGAYPLPNRVENAAKVLGLDGSLVPMAVVALGYPAVDPVVKDKWDPENIIWK